MKIEVPRIRGLIRRRLLVNYRIDAKVMRAQLPAPFRPKLQAGYAVAGICLIRLEQIGPRFWPRTLGLASENAAHRIAVEWDGRNGVQEGVYIPRRDSTSWLNHVVGGRIFPGEHHQADFEVTDVDELVVLDMHSSDGQVTLQVHGRPATELPSSSIFSNLEEASGFFERGFLGYSLTQDPGRYDGLVLETKEWQVAPLVVEQVHSSYFEDGDLFPAGSAEFDHALIMRDIEHEWIVAEDLYGPAIEKP